MQILLKCLGDIKRESERERENIEAEGSTWNYPADKIQRQSQEVRSKNIMSCSLSSCSASQGRWAARK